MEALSASNYSAGGPRRQVVSWMVFVQLGLHWNEALDTGAKAGFAANAETDNQYGADKTKAQSVHCSLAYRSSCKWVAWWS